MARERITVNPNKDKGWTVKQGGKVVDEPKTQQAGIDKAVSVAKAIEKGGGKAQVLIKNREGQIRDERTFGDDPKKTLG